MKTSFVKWAFVYRPIKGEENELSELYDTKRFADLGKALMKQAGRTAYISKVQRVNVEIDARRK